MALHLDLILFRCIEYIEYIIFSAPNYRWVVIVFCLAQSSTNVSSTSFRQIRMSNGSKGYRIFRKTDQSDDSLDSFEWNPPKDSDELYDALKTAFSKGTTHRYRMRQALIEFLLSEREVERDSQRPTIPIVEGGDARAEKYIAEYRQNPHRNKARGSKSQPQVTSNYEALLPPNPQDEQTQAPRKKKVKDWESMTVVWTSESGVKRGPRPKRAMTEEERIEYQLRRVRGACVSCKKRKRKVSCCFLILSWNSLTSTSVTMTLLVLPITQRVTGTDLIFIRHIRKSGLICIHNVKLCSCQSLQIPLIP